MFRCEKCNNIAKQMHKLVTVIRRRTYERRPYKIIKKGKRKFKKRRDPIVEGWEVVRESKLCRSCFNKNRNKKPEVIKNV